ncbi:fused MFS/spermidine synthase [Myxococcota bacterium]|nr:fused MFS/spermidine synthase [Myxococcota bacterium]
MIRTLALLLTGITGFSGLVYEVTWEKYLATLLGSHSEATAALLGLYLGGLALGYASFGRLSRREMEKARRTQKPAMLLVQYGIVEAGIGLWASLFSVLFEGVRTLSLWLPFGTSPVGFVADIFLCALLVLPPATLMGATIPMLTQALSRGLLDATRLHALVYGVNTAGAVAGAVAAGFWLIPTFGLVNTCYAMGGVNLVVGCVFILLGTRGPAVVAPTEHIPVSDPTQPSPRVMPFAIAALLCGFALMTIETVLIRLGSLSFGASHFTFSMVVAAFVLCIALGSFAVSTLGRIPRWVVVGNLWALGLSTALLYPFLPDATYWAHVLRTTFPSEPSSFHSYHLAAFAWMVAVLGIPVALSGATLPLIFHHLRGEVNDLGDVAGRIYSWNTVGSLLGALLGGYALFHWMELDQIFRLALGAIGLAALIITWRIANPRSTTLAVISILTLCGITLLPEWSRPRLIAGLFRAKSEMPNTWVGPERFFGERTPPTLRFYRDDPTASIAVIERKFKGLIERSIVTNGKSDSNTVGDYPTMAMAALLPALYVDQAQRSFVVGFGAGVTVGELASIDSMREVVVAEIAPAVLEGAHWFDDANQNASRNPKVEFVVGDAFRSLMRSEGRFDIIASEPSNPWVLGVEMLYSEEFLRTARDHLTPGGVYAQWMHTYETDRASLELVLRTYARVFDRVSVWYGIGSDLILLGFNEDAQAVNLERMRARFERTDLRAGFQRAGIENFAALLAHEVLPEGVTHAMGLRGATHTLLHPRLSDLAARAFFVGANASLRFSGFGRTAQTGAQNSLLANHLRKQDPTLSEADWSSLSREMCRYRAHSCATVLARWQVDVPESTEREAVIHGLRTRGDLPLQSALANLPFLIALFDGPLPDDGDALTRARLSTELFMQGYLHGLPFSRAALDRIWDACDSVDDLRKACASDRLVATQQVGAFSRRDPEETP